MTTAEPAVQQYFQTVRSAFEGFEIYLDDISRSGPTARAGPARADP